MSILAVLRRVPGIAWVFALVIASLASAGWAIYARGVRRGEVRVHQQALADSVQVAEARRDTAQAHSDKVVHVAAKARVASDSLLERRVAVRQAALAELLDAGLPKIHALVALDDSIATSVTVTTAVQAGAIDTLLSERTARQWLDTLRVNQVAIGTPGPDHHTTRKIVAGAVLGVLAALTFSHVTR